MQTPSYDYLLDENRVLKERLAALTAPDATLRLHSALSLTPKEAKLLAVMLDSPEPLDKGRLYDLVFQYDNGDGPEVKIVDVVICKIRRKAEKGGWPGKIETLWGTGYRLSQELRLFLSSIAHPEAVAA